MPEAQPQGVRVRGWADSIQGERRPRPGSQPLGTDRSLSQSLQPGEGRDTRACQYTGVNLSPGPPCSEHSGSGPTDTKFRERKRYLNKKKV